MIAPGIYFGLPSEDYHADPALGGTDVNLLARDPVEFQFRRLQPEKEETAALVRGQAQHARCLEGRTAFERGFKTIPDRADYPEPILDTIEELREHAVGLGLDKLPRLKADLISMIRLVDQEVVIWQEIMWQHEADPRTPIPKTTALAIEQSAQWMQADPLIGAVMEDGTFQGGQPEVSVFWEEAGLRLKARFDYLLPHAIVDLKTFSPWRDQTIEAGAINAIVSYRYDLQAAHYMRGWQAASQHWRKRARFEVRGDKINPLAAEALCKLAFAHDVPLWIWVFTKTIGAPQPIVLEWSHERALFSFSSAETEVTNALIRYLDLVKEFGADKPWPPRHKAVLIEDSMWPPWFGRR